MLLPHLVDGKEGEVGELRDAPNVREHEVHEVAVRRECDEGKASDEGGAREHSVGSAEDLVARAGVDEQRAVERERGGASCESTVAATIRREERSFFFFISFAESDDLATVTLKAKWEAGP